MAWVEGQNRIFFASQYRTIFADLCVVSVSRFWRTEFSFHVEYYVLFLRRNWLCSYEFFSRQNGLSTQAVIMGGMETIFGERQHYLLLAIKTVQKAKFLWEQQEQQQTVSGNII